MRQTSAQAWGEAGDRTVVHAEVVALPVREGMDRPDGTIAMRWTDGSGFTHDVNLVHWWPLNRDGLAPGVAFEVDVQAQQRRDLSCPTHHVTAHLTATGDPHDTAQVMIGDPDREGSWAYGVVFYGAVLTQTSLVVDGELSD